MLSTIKGKIFKSMTLVMIKFSELYTPQYGNLVLTLKHLEDGDVENIVKDYFK